MRPGRPAGRQLIARTQTPYKRGGADSKEAIMLRSRAKRVAAVQVLDGNPARGQSSYAGAGMGTSDRVTNRKPRKPRIR